MIPITDAIHVGGTVQRQEFAAGLRVPAAGGDLFLEGVVFPGRKEQRGNEAQAFQETAAGGGVVVGQVVAAQLRAERIERRTFTEKKARKVGLDVHGVHDGLRDFRGNAFFGKAAAQPGRQSEQHRTFPAEGGGIKVVNLKQVLSVEAVIGEGLAQKKHLGKHRAQGKEEFVRFNNQGFRHRTDAAQELRAKSHAAGSQKAFAKTKEARVSSGIQAEAGRIADQFAALAAAGENFGNAVAEEANGGIGGKSSRNRGEFARRPPIVAIEKND